ncbi:hypothetical protein ACFRAO_11060 [Streptomyces sp. NPDC056656]|uniref:hypothetical protein n=1 Tax=unclassified Streptomyces TaxID=2593676 RepID=UPI002E30BEEA|nr:hypothetical protein [Streptomyces sp. NBC_01361]
MNGTSASTAFPAEAPSSRDLVEVVLGDCSAPDADAVFHLLGDHFDSDRGEAVPHGNEGPRPAAWTGNFLVEHAPAEVSGVALAGTVTADLQGCPVAVERLCRTLDAAFAVEKVGTVAGDQEVEVQLHLTNP